MIKAMLSTSDNPFNPFDQFVEWNSFDQEKNYNSCSYLARIARTSDSLSDEDEALAVETAVDEIVRLNLTGNYIKVTKEF